MLPSMALAGGSPAELVFALAVQPVSLSGVSAAAAAEAPAAAAEAPAAGMLEVAAWATTGPRPATAAKMATTPQASRRARGRARPPPRAAVGGPSDPVVGGALPGPPLRGTNLQRCLIMPCHTPSW